MAETEMIPVRWPAGLRDRVRALAGHRGVTGFVVAAVLEKVMYEEMQRMEAAGEDAVDVGAAGTPERKEPGGGPPYSPNHLRTVPCPEFRPSAGNALRCECGRPARVH